MTHGDVLRVAGPDPLRAVLGADRRFQRPLVVDTLRAMTSTQPAPSWLAELGRDPALRAAGFELLAPDDAEQRTTAQREFYAGDYHLGTLWLPSIWQECRERVAAGRVVARGPARLDAMQVEHVSEFVLMDDELWLAGSSQVPASLWIPCGRTAASVAAAIGEFWPLRRPLRHQFDGHTRLFMGYRGEVAVPNPYSGEFVPADPHDFTRHFNFSPVVDPQYWSSSRIDDPWPAPEDGPLSVPMNVVIQRDVTKQAEGGTCSFTRRTKFSGSYLGIELHRGRLWVWDILHPCSRHAAVIERLNEKHGMAFPTSLPFDVVGAMLGFAHLSVAQLRRDMAAADARGSEELPAYIEAVAALQHADSHAAHALLRSYIDHPEPSVRATVVNLAAYYGWLTLLEEVRLRDADPEMDAWIDNVLPFGLPEEFDDMGEPLGSGDEDDEDYADELEDEEDDR